MKQLFLLFAFVLTYTCNAEQTYQTNKDTTQTLSDFRGGFSIYPVPNKTRLGFRSNINKKWAFDSKFGYTFTLAPQFNIELNVIRRFKRMDILNFYTGFGATLDGFTPGVNIPIGFELMPFEKHKNLVFVAEASPKITFSFSSAFSSTLNGTIGFIYFRPQKQKNDK